MSFAIGKDSTQSELNQEYRAHPCLPAAGSPSGARIATGAPGLSTAHISPWYRIDNRVVVRDWNSGADGGEAFGRETWHPGQACPVEFDDGRVDVWDGGNLIRCRLPYSTSTGKRKGGGRRGQIHTFTKASRRRLLRMMARVKRSELPLFVHLTYPGEFSRDPKVWKRDLDTWVKRLHRAYPQAGLIWRMEPQKRLAPHFHLLVWGIPARRRQGLIDVQSWVSRSWYEVVGSGDIRHFNVGTRVERVRSPRGAMAYAGKYLAKVPEPESGRVFYVDEDGCCSTTLDSWSNAGRWWGVRYQENIPWAERVTLEVSPDVAHRLMDALIAHAGLPDGDWRSVTVFAVGREWLEWLHEMSPP